MKPADFLVFSLSLTFSWIQVEFFEFFRYYKFFLVVAALLNDVNYNFLLGTVINIMVDI